MQWSTTGTVTEATEMSQTIAGALLTVSQASGEMAGAPPPSG